ncbi:uncharacterized protein A4U43_C05F11570 [Asparagus officinalis]|uniref:Uncharacterized protein n=1 Tax=Asparagus officinalis TaxID=4686 RepID=A0A5P1ER01_ASPOF|nr:uncharacterized protein A4U43_C05F11570 [Asparagus officinalis]
MKSTAAGKPKAYRKERDEDLLLFHEMFTRGKERNASLLDPVSSEFESSRGSFPFYKLSSEVKGPPNDFLGVEKEKNDYDWLKTPPATPLFPSLEMEVNDANTVFQRELPILQHISKPSRSDSSTYNDHIG